jgi:hypothetical protein
MKTTRLVLVAALGVAGSSYAASPTPAEPDKSGYDLFHPVPDDLLRELDTDRPDKTNSPHTLDAGHLQIETGVARFTSNTDAGVRTRGWTFVDTDARIGLTNWAELQVELPFYESMRETDLASDRTQHSRGLGDLSVVGKANFWGNDQGDTAAGMELFVVTPTGADGIGDGELEGGAAFLFSVTLPAGFDLAVNGGFDVVPSEGGGHHADLVNSISVSRAIAGPLSAYLEFFSSVPTQQSADWDGTVDVGSTLTIGKNFQLDAGLNVGVTHAADDLQPFLGASYRF